MARRGEWTPAGGGQIYGRGPSNRAPVQNNAVGSSPAAVAAMIANTPTAAPPLSIPVITPPGSLPIPAAPIIPSSSYNPPPPPSPTPPSPWNVVPTFTQPSGIKQADPDIIIDADIDTTGDFIAERFFEELGGTELINLSRYDLIDGIDVSYQPIANLSRLRRRFNPNNIIALDILSDNEFSKFNINILDRGMNEPYFDDNGNLVVEIDIIRPQENIEVEISLSGTVTRIEL